MKIVKPNGGTGTMSSWKYTIWAYDLGGNVMAEYGVDYLSDENKYTLNAKAHFLYGAGRLGKDLRDSTGYLNLALRPAGAYTEVRYGYAKQQSSVPLRQQCSAYASAWV